MQIEKGAPFAVPWYENEQLYLTVRDMLPASERQDPFTYDRFISNIKDMEKNIQRQGGIPYRIPINAVTLKGWCDANNLQVCRKSITEYVCICLKLRLDSSGAN